tara:strand:+ start:1572 stop:1964 length:393 start_codon:yes stop_codon:yes gene_type:complete
MKKSVNKPWAISDKYRNKYGVIWSDMDFEINPKISTYQFKNDPLNTNVGVLKICGKTIPMQYKQLLSAANVTADSAKAVYFEKPEKWEKFAINVLNQELYLKKHEIGKLAETLEDTTEIISKSYELGLYL